MEVENTSRLKVLLIEGDRASAAKVKDALDHFAPLELTVVDSMESALAIRERERFTLILADLSHLENGADCSLLIRAIRGHGPGMASIVFFRKSVRKGKLVSSVAYALSRRKGTLAVRSEESRLALLRSLLALSLQADSLEATCSEIARTICYLTGFSSVTISLNTNPPVQIVCSGKVGVREEAQVRVSAGKHASAEAAGDFDWERAGAPVQEMQLPLQTGRRKVGLVTLSHEHPIEPDIRMLRFIGSLGWEISAIVQNAAKRREGESARW
jgi:hypothetical protein